VLISPSATNQCLQTGYEANVTPAQPNSVETPLLPPQPSGHQLQVYRIPPTPAHTQMAAQSGQTSWPTPTNPLITGDQRPGQTNPYPTPNQTN